MSEDTKNGGNPELKNEQLANQVQKLAVMDLHRIHNARFGDGRFHWVRAREWLHQESRQIPSFLTHAEFEAMTKELIVRSPEELDALRRHFAKIDLQIGLKEESAPVQPPKLPPGQMMAWIAKACFTGKYESVFEPMIADYRFEVQKGRAAGYSRVQLAKLHCVYWIGFLKACGIFTFIERVTKYFTSS